MRHSIFLVFSALICGVSLSPAQTDVTVELVAYNKNNHTVRDLTPGDVELKVDGREVDIRSLRLESKQPPRTILLVDSSSAAMNNRSLLKDIVAAFIDFKPPQLEMAIGTINDTQQFLSPYQTSSDELVNALQRIKFGGRAPLSTSILAALNHFDPTPKPTRKMLILFSDGTDDSTGQKWLQAQKALKENEFVIYEVNPVKAIKVIFDFKFVDKDLVRLAEETGGQAFRIAELGEVGRVAREIFDRETTTYHATLRFDAKLSPSDRLRIKVKSRRKGIRLEVVAVH